MRAVEQCPHRDPTGADGGPSCGLVSGVFEAEPPGSGAVGLDACRACCAGPVPDCRRPSPVVATLVARAAEEVARAGGVPGCDPDRAADLRRWAHDRLSLISVVRPSRELPRPSRKSTAVVIPCHDHGEFLGEAIASAMGQTVPPDEVLVVDDASSDDTAEVAGRYASSGVRYLRVEHGSVYRARAAGLAATRSEVLCFLDADDLLPPDYLERGLPLFDRPEIGVAYPDLEFFGEEVGRRTFPEFDRGCIEFSNYMIASSLVRRRALEIADAFREPDMTDAPEDWVVWRRVVEAGWSGVKHPGSLRYRRHGADRPSRSSRSIGRPYYDEAGLKHADVTIVTPLSGRSTLWPSYRDWLDAQTWPRGLCQVFLADSSADARFGREVRRYLASCDYPSTRYLTIGVTETGLADKPRAEYAGAVNLICARIYNRVAREISTPFVLVVEDDIVPPAGVVEQLLRSMDERTAAVAAPYYSRYQNVYVAWDDQARHYTGGEGVQSIGGCGFGCLLIRRAVFLGETFHFGYAESPWFDPAYCRRLRLAGWSIKIDWSQRCVHRDER